MYYQARLTYTSRKSTAPEVAICAKENERPEDSEIEVANMTPGIGQLDAFPGPWGHWSGGPPPFKGNANLKWLDDHLREFFTHGVKFLEGMSKLSVNEGSLHKS